MRNINLNNQMNHDLQVIFFVVFLFAFTMAGLYKCKKRLSKIKE